LKLLQKSSLNATSNVKDYQDEPIKIKLNVKKCFISSEKMKRLVHNVFFILTLCSTVLARVIFFKFHHSKIKNIFKIWVSKIYMKSLLRKDIQFEDLFKSP